jgi:hypothetical protein
MISSLCVCQIPPLSQDIPHEPPGISLDILFPFPSFRLLFHLRDCRQWIDSQQHPTRSKQLITGCCAAHYPHFSNISVGCQVWLLHIPLQMFLFQGKGLTPLRTQGSPLRSDPILRYRCGLDKPLTSFTPHFKNKQLSGFRRKPFFSFFFS